MGTFLGHIIPGLAFTIIGIWHTLNTIKTYKLKGPSNFTSSTWFPFTSTTTPVTIPKHSELYLLLSFSAAAAAVQILDYPLLSLSFKPDNYEHATMFLHLAVYASVALAVDLSASPDALRSLVGTLAASLVVAFSFLATVTTVGLPSSFMAATVRSASFSWTLAGIAVLVAYLCLRTDSKCVEYRKLRSGGGDVSLISSPEAEDLKQSQPSV
ncbi:hypothetical protein ACMD2_25565 [Ananas comosus]|uniref:Uncharacterized protein n=1 Tax=Ananas comosus TaxID=4615 RepID=A0A199W0X9_ANACO|nr:hypothetical protein ACMD2_25565 [Ananas comosus]